MRDYIPEGAAATPLEQRTRELTRRRGTSGQLADWIPDADTPSLAEPGGKFYSAKEALDRTLVAQATAAAAELTESVDRLKKMTVAQAIAHIQNLPYSQMELYLAAETLYGNRKSLLERFPPVDPAVIDRIKLIGADAAPAASDPDEAKE